MKMLFIRYQHKDIFKGVVNYDFTFLTLVSVNCCYLSINDIIKVTTLKVQSKGRYLLLKKRTTTNSW